jgi:hypothetical protein
MSGMQDMEKKDLRFAFSPPSFLLHPYLLSSAYLARINFFVTV